MDEMIDVLDSLQKYVPTVPKVPGSRDEHLFFNIGIGVYMYMSDCFRNILIQPIPV